MAIGMAFGAVRRLMVRLGVGNAVGAAAKDSCCFLFRLGSDSLRRRLSVGYYTAAGKIPQYFRSLTFCGILPGAV